MTRKGWKKLDEDRWECRLWQGVSDEPKAIVWGMDLNGKHIHRWRVIVHPEEGGYAEDALDAMVAAESAMRRRFKP